VAVFGYKFFVIVMLDSYIIFFINFFVQG